MPKPNKKPTKIELQFGKRIKQLRKEKNWTQKELALRMEIEVSNLKKYETGRQGITLNMLNKMAKAFGITVSELLKLN